MSLLAVLAAPGAAAAQTPPGAEAKPQQLWHQSNASVLLTTASVTLPDKARGLRVNGTREFSHEGEGVDAPVQYRSPDGPVVATAYLFYLGLPHAGLATLAAHDAVRSNSPAP